MRKATAVQLTTAAAAFLFISAAPAHAKPLEECAAEIEKYCEDAPSGRGINTCLREHESKLSPACAKALEAWQQRASDKRKFRRPRPSWLDPCAGDIQKLCKNIPVGRGRIAECLTNRQAELSIACRLAFAPPTP